MESLRLRSKLTTSIQVTDELLNAEIPVLSIQPLVENAVKHGVAPRSAKGFVNLNIWSEESQIKIQVVNSGEKFSIVSRNDTRDGVGLANVRRRLMLCFGFNTELYISSQDGHTAVGFSMPLIRRPVSSDGYEATVRKTA